ncbi:MAG TPA: TetR/AcrR family transcriptional regulator [Candidatus Limnocylindrales bacterium]|nr:TetR/AcrR family transcriptional regulator [Candidatus Limnocylindrales bacterium]
MVRVKAEPGGLELMARLVDEGARLLVEEGPGGISLRKVAAAAGVSTMPVYTLFGDKRGLLLAMHREGFQRLGAALRDVPESDNPLQHLGLLGIAYREAALRSPNLYGLMFGHEVASVQPDERGRSAADAAYRPLVEAVIRCQDAGILVAADPERIALHLWAVAHGMVSLELNGKLPQLGSMEDLYLQALNHAAAPFVLVDKT